MPRRNPDRSERSPLLGEATRQNDASDAENGQLPQSDNSGAENEREPPNAYLLLPALAIGLLLSALDQLIIIASYAKIGNDLHALNNVGWVATSYLLAITSFQPLFGKFCDIFGRKESLLSAYILFGLGCLACGLSQTLVQLCLSRALAGIGGGGMTAVVSIILSDIVPLRERGVWQGYLNIIYSLGTTTGAPLGGLLADTIGWRWAFIGQAPLCLVAFATVYFYLDLPRSPADHWLAKVRRVDFLGAFTLIAAIVSLFIGLDIGSNRGWSQITAIVPIAVSPALFGLFIFIEIRVASHPFAPGHVIFSPGMFPSYLCNFFTIGAMFGSLFLVPLYFQAVRGESATKGGLYLIPTLLCTVAASLGAGFYVKKAGKYYWQTFWANAIMGVAMVSLMFGVWYNQILVVIISLSVLGACGGSVITTTLVALLANAAEEDTAVVVACSYLFRSLGSSLGITVSSAVLQQLLRSELASRLPSGDQAREIEKQVRENLDYIKHLSKELAAIVRSSYLYACTGALSPLFICGVLAFVCSFWIKEKPLKR